jgi:AcrR family transcriptional regulator
MGKARTVRTLTRARELFVEALAGGASVTRSCEAAGVGRTTAYQWRKDDEAFAALWDDALEAGTDLLEDEARRRAVEGVERPVVAMGKIARNDDGTVLKIREYSDTLLALMLKAKKPKEYRDRLDVNANHTGTVNLTVSSDDAAL